jgi:hypothetical protein
MCIDHRMWILVGAFLSLQCINPFAPRLDTGLNSTSCSDLTILDNMFCAFRNAYAFKDTTLYGTLIDPEFTFSYRDYDLGVDVTWGRDDEMRSTYGLFQSVQSLSLIWNNIISTDTGSLRRTVVRGFNLTVTFNPGDIERVDGYANLTFVRSDLHGQWRLFYWRDESNYMEIFQ